MIPPGTMEAVCEPAGGKDDGSMPFPANLQGLDVMRHRRAVEVVREAVISLEARKERTRAPRSMKTLTDSIGIGPAYWRLVTST